MKRQAFVLILATLLLLAACAAPTADVPVEQPTEAVAPTEAAAPTAQPAEGATEIPAPTDSPTEEPTEVPTEAPTEVPTATPAAQPTATPAAPEARFGSEVLFLREGDLWAVNVETLEERVIAEAVRDFAATRDGTLIALVRENGDQTDLWTVRRDGSDLTQRTADARVEAVPSWADDGSALVYASSASAEPYARNWPDWSRWCATSEVRLFELDRDAVVTLDAGCDPAFAPNGQRIAYATPPQSVSSGLDFAGENNAIRLVNRQGENGWNFATATGAVFDPTSGEMDGTGLLVYAPAWSPDGAQIVYQRFLGYQALVDISLSEIAPSFSGAGEPLYNGAGWLLPAHFTPDGAVVAISENNYSDARGLSGYDVWSVTTVRLEGSRQTFLPSGEFAVEGQVTGELERGQVAVWSPDGATLAVQLPPNWRPDMEPVEPDGEPVATVAPGEIWRWQPGASPAEPLVSSVDPASPLAWLPATGE